MNKSRSNVFIMLNLIVSFFISACSSPREQVKIENGTFNINGKDVQLICGEMHYPRIPHEYWRDRLHRARAPCLLMYSGTSTNGNPEYLISADKRILPSLYVLHRKKGCMSFFVPGHTCVRNGISEVILRGS